MPAGIAILLVTLFVVVVLSGHPVGARIAVLLAGLCFAVPFFLSTTPLFACLLLCLMGAPFIAASALLFAPPLTGFRPRLAYLFTWGGTRQVRWRARGFDVAASLHLIAATAVLTAALAVVIAAPGWGVCQLLLRWFAGGIIPLAFAEMATASLPLAGAAFGVILPPLMQSPWRAASLGEFWSERWNLFAANLFRKFCFAPMARHGVALALYATFLASAIVHFLLALAVLGNLKLSLIFGSFFLAQPFLIRVERHLHVRRWRPAAGRIWTLTALAITSPLFVEPLLEFFERSWGAPESAFFPALATLGLVIVFSLIVALASLSARPTVAKVYTA